MKLRKHIAFLLFGIFFFPIIFQSIHIASHRAHGCICEHHLCHAESSDKDSPVNAEDIAKNENKCAICEYQFSINDLPDIPISRAVIRLFICTLIEKPALQQYKEIFTHKSPRAPPTLIS